MTRPEERMRALRWGEALLQAIQRDAEVAQDLKNEARLLALNYPTLQALEALLEAGEPLLPPSLAQVIEQAGRLFEAVQLRPGVGTAELKRHALYTLRHFPGRGEALYAADPGIHGGLVAWLDKGAP